MNRILFLSLVVSFSLSGCSRPTIEQSQTIEQSPASGQSKTDELRTTELLIVEQDYDEALKLAKKENKLVFIDCYADWCGPCKELDKLVFQDPARAQSLAKDFVLLKYNVMKDKQFNLGKKYHVCSYPTGLILTNDGFVVNRKYGFQGETADELAASVSGFASESVQLNSQGKTLKGYSNSTEISEYPSFYADDYLSPKSLNASSTPEFESYWKGDRDRFSEQYFATLSYFADELPHSTADQLLKDKDRYVEQFGEKTVGYALWSASRGRFGSAIAAKNKELFDKAAAFAKVALGDDSKDFISSYAETFNEAVTSELKADEPKTEG